MKPEERLKIGLDLMEFGWLFLMRLEPRERQRRLDLRREPWNPPEPVAPRT